MKTRAERRHHHKRMIERVKDFSWIKSLGLWNTSEEEKRKHIAKMVENRKICSCHMCRNPRTSKILKNKDKLTIQERRLYDDRPED